MTGGDRPGAEDAIDPRVERSRAAVVGAAAELMLAEGPDAITHVRVAAAAGVSRTTVYKHYPERADLLRATVEELGKTLPDPQELTGDLRSDLRAFVGMLADDLRDEGRSKVMATMIERAQHDPTVAHVRDGIVADFGEAFAELLRRAVADGAIRGDIDEFRALAGLGGSLLFARFLADRVIDDALLDAVIDDFITANRPR